MLTVGFYTPSYEREAALLARSLDRVGMAYAIEGVEDAGGWDQNTALKAGFIQRMRREHSGPLLYLDVDAFVHENCDAYFEELGERGIDFGAHWFAGPAKGHNFERDNCACLHGGVCARPHRLLSGTLFFGDTTRARELLSIWESVNRTLALHGWPQGGGQRNLWALVTAQARMLKVERIPGRYTYVFDKPHGYPIGEPCVIEHLIASRENRGESVGRVNVARRERIRQLWERV